MVIGQECQSLIAEQQIIIEEIMKKATRLREIQNILFQGAPVEPHAETDKKPMPKHFGPDPNFIPPTAPTPEKRMLDDHTITWDRVTKKF